jgi:hypothetical protein
MEPVESVRVSLPQDPRDLGVEAVVLWRLLPRVDLEFLRDRVDALSSTSSSAPYAGAAGNTMPGNSTTACRVGTASTLLVDSPFPHCFRSD